MLPENQVEHGTDLCSPRLSYRPTSRPGWIRTSDPRFQKYPYSTHRELSCEASENQVGRGGPFCEEVTATYAPEAVGSTPRQRQLVAIPGVRGRAIRCAWPPVKTSPVPEDGEELGLRELSDRGVTGVRPSVSLDVATKYPQSSHRRLSCGYLREQVVRGYAPSARELPRKPMESNHEVTLNLHTGSQAKSRAVLH